MDGFDDDDLDGFDLLDEFDENMSSKSDVSKDAKRARTSPSLLTPAARVLLHEAQTAFLSARLSDAWELCKSVVRLCPTAHEVYSLMASVEQERNGHNSLVAAELVFLACVYDKEASAHQWAEAADLAPEHDTRRRLECWKHVLRIDPTRLDIRRLRLALFGQSQLALTDLRCLWSKTGETAIALALARVCLQLGRLEEGLLVLRSLGEATHENVDVCCCLAELYLVARRFDDAEALLRKCKDANHPLALALRGSVACKRGNVADAEKVWPATPQCQGGRAALVIAQTLIESGSISLVMPWIESALAAEDCYCEAEFARSLVLEQRGDLDSAFAAVSTLLDRDFCVAGMHEFLLRHTVHPLASRLSTKLSVLSNRIFNLDQEVAILEPDTKKKISKEKDDAVIDAQHIGGWRHAVPDKQDDEIELEPPLKMTPKAFYLRVLDLFDHGRVGELLRFSAPILEADQSRRRRHRKTPERQPRQGDMTYLANELSERK